MTEVLRAGPLSLLEFVNRWRRADLPERAAAQSHFIELCHVLGQPTPTEADQSGSFYTFEKGVTKVSGHKGFADVWFRGHFAWEYKGRHKDLKAAYKQLLNYREDLENPPLLVVCDLYRFEVHTNFTGTAKRIYEFTLDDLLVPEPLPRTSLSALQVLQALFTAPERLRPDQTASQVTEAAAAEFARLAQSLRERGIEAERAAHFLMRLLFCLFAEDIGLLPEHLFTKLVENTKSRPHEFSQRVSALFAAMETGGFFGYDDIPHFNGGLFADHETLDLTSKDLEALLRACRLDWASVEPAIFGTLFERSLDPNSRAQLGAHYTSKEDILMIVEPVLMAPLRREWAEVQDRAREIVERRDQSSGQARRNRERELTRLLLTFADRIAAVRVLDPACGSGNFLYVALKRLLDLQKEVVSFALANGMSAFFPTVGPEQLFGLEVNLYAHELAQVVVWIGYIQWLHDNGFGIPESPILKPLGNIERKDAILACDEAGNPVEPPWPAVDVIIGNPPFLGGKLMRTELGDSYVNALFTLYRDRVPREADLVTYWFERAREQIAAGLAERAGLLATNSIRGGANRRVLTRIKETGDIFMAWSDRPWILDGAAVRVSMVGFDGGAEKVRLLDGMQVSGINADLTSTLDLTEARRLQENMDIAFMGDTKGGAFDITADVAVQMLTAPLNPNGRPNSDVVRPWVNGLDITRRPRGMWIIDFGVDMPEGEAALYEAPFGYVLRHVRAAREASKTTRAEWWLHERPRVEMRAAIAPLPRYIGTARVAKHRLFVWLKHPTLPDSQVIVTARSDDYFFGVLHSKVHELWSLRMGTWLGVGNDPRYTPSTTFETFPFPWPPGSEPEGDLRVDTVAEAAAELVEKRDAWLNPAGATEAELRSRTLTNLYNERPTWLDLAHRKLDEAVLDAYGWPHDMTNDEILERLLALNLARAAPEPVGGTIVKGPPGGGPGAD